GRGGGGRDPRLGGGAHADAPALRRLRKLGHHEGRVRRGRDVRPLALLDQPGGQGGGPVSVSRTDAHADLALRVRPRDAQRAEAHRRGRLGGVAGGSRPLPQALVVGEADPGGGAEPPRRLARRHRRDAHDEPHLLDLGAARRALRRAPRSAHQPFPRRGRISRDQVVRDRRAGRHGIGLGRDDRLSPPGRAGVLLRGVCLLRLPRRIRAAAPHPRAAVPAAGDHGRERARAVSDERNLWSRRLATDFRASLVVIALIALAPLAVSSDYTLGILIVSMYFALLAMGWNLLAGFAGQFSLAPAAFAMLGAYGPGLLDYHWKVPVAWGILGGVAATALLGWILGRIVLRLRGPYLALTTLSFAEIARVVIGNSYDFTRGAQGLNVPTLMESRLGYYYLFLAVVLAVLVGLHLLMRASPGRFWLAIRDDETGAESRGINVVRYKTLAFALS